MQPFEWRKSLSFVNISPTQSNYKENYSKLTFLTITFLEIGVIAQQNFLQPFLVISRVAFDHLVNKGMKLSS